jgi:hypothetical protein
LVVAPTARGADADLMRSAFRRSEAARHQYSGK